MRRQISLVIVTLMACAAGCFTAAAQPSNAVTTAPVFVPDYSHAGEPLPDGVIDWARVLGILRDANWSGVLSVECGTPEQALRSRVHLDALIGQTASV